MPLPQEVDVNIRPFARECLSAANEHYEVIVFTAGLREYADPILDKLDPDGSLISYRLYREHCYQVQCADKNAANSIPELNTSTFVKDLRILGGRDLKEILIVDNSIFSFAAQLDNGIPISDFIDDKSDKELRTLTRYIRRAASYSDVRLANREQFGLSTRFGIDKSAGQSPSFIMYKVDQEKEQLLEDFFQFFFPGG